MEHAYAYVSLSWDNACYHGIGVGCDSVLLTARKSLTIAAPTVLADDRSYYVDAVMLRLVSCAGC